MAPCQAAASPVDFFIFGFLVHFCAAHVLLVAAVRLSGGCDGLLRRLHVLCLLYGPALQALLGTIGALPFGLQSRCPSSPL